jgi:hypothetical protein
MKIEIRNEFRPYGMTNWFVLLSRNGQVMMTSETYDSPGNARRAARKLGRKLNLKVSERS